MPSPSLYHHIDWNLRRTVAPAAAITLADFKSHIRKDGTDEDTLLTAYLDQAERTVEEELGVSLLQQTWVLRLDRFPGNEIRLPRPPLQSITSIGYVDVDGASQTVDSADYTVDVHGGMGLHDTAPGHVRPLWGTNWPATRRQPSAVTVTYVAGYSALPAMLKAAILLTAADLYENRELSGPQALQQIALYERLMTRYRCEWEPEYR